MVSLLNRIGNVARFSYDALKPDKKRKSISSKVPREDAFAKGSKRRNLQANASDLSRNLALAGWMVRRHLDYVSQFAFYSRNQTGSDDAVGKDLDDQIQALMIEDSIPSRTDVANRFGREKMFRLAETRRVLDGDTYLLKLANMKLQGIGGDLVRDPTDKIEKTETWINGHNINKVGGTKEIAIYSRKRYEGVEFDRRISFSNVFHYGFFDRYASDQTRGISPMIAALNPLRDVYENFDFALAKSKISQLFAMAIMQDGPDSALPLDGATTQAPEDQDGDHVEDTDRGFESFVKSDLRFLDLNVGEKVEIIESKQPSGEFQNFTQLVIAVSLKALDIPFSFYDESFTNFFGSRAAWLHYERSCADKRADQIELRRQYTLWKLRGWIISGRLVLPAGLTIADIKFEWVPRGLPWFDPAKEVRGAVQSINAGLDNPQRICMSTGTDYFDNVDKIAAAQDYAASRGVEVSWEDSTPPPIEVTNVDNDNSQTKP